MHNRQVFHKPALVWNLTMDSETMPILEKIVDTDQRTLKLLSRCVCSS